MTRSEPTRAKFKREVFGELERYGLLALFATLLLGIGYLFDGILLARPPIRSARFRIDSQPSPNVSKEASPVALAATARTVSEIPDSPGGGQREPLRSVRPLASNRADFNFYEAPVPVPGQPQSKELLRPQASDLPSTALRAVSIRSGDTLQKIAARELRSSKDWRSLLSLNPGIDPKRLRPGHVLFVPAAPPVVASAPPVVPLVGKTYRVRKNDTLEEISRRFYGRRDQWIDILEVNRDLLKTPHSLREGQLIRIP